MADCERGLGRPDRALELARSEDVESLDNAGKVELAMVVSGARSDLGEYDAAVAALEIPQLDMNRAFSYSPRLFRTYADALDAAGRNEEAASWRRQALVAESAMGVGDFAEPDIVDLVGDEESTPERPSHQEDGQAEDGQAEDERVEDRPAAGPESTPEMEEEPEEEPEEPEEEPAEEPEEPEEEPAEETQEQPAGEPSAVEPELGSAASGSSEGDVVGDKQVAGNDD